MSFQHFPIQWSPIIWECDICGVGWGRWESGPIIIHRVLKTAKKNPNSWVIVWRLPLPCHFDPCPAVKGLPFWTRISGLRYIQHCELCAAWKLVQYWRQALFKNQHSSSTLTWLAKIAQMWANLFWSFVPLFFLVFPSVLRTYFQIAFWGVRRVVNGRKPIKIAHRKCKMIGRGPGMPLPTILHFYEPYWRVLRPFTTILTPQKAIENRFGQHLFSPFCSNKMYKPSQGQHFIL